MPSSELPVRSGYVDQLPARTLYRILALRGGVFVVEQECCYADLDGRDLEPGATLLWIVGGSGGPDDEVLATLRVLDEPDGSVRIGRVATAAAARGRGLAGALLAEALRLAGTRSVRLDAQSHLAGWYEGYGFVRDGGDFVEDGIPHTPMRRGATSTATSEPG
jgi:ElaA protein